MNNAYRDDKLAAQQRTDALRQGVEARARRMNPALREWLPAELQQRLQMLEASVRTNATSLDGLRALGDALVVRKKSVRSPYRPPRRRQA